jgi:hypothetical protein
VVLVRALGGDAESGLMIARVERSDGSELRLSEGELVSRCRCYIGSLSAGSEVGMWVRADQRRVAELPAARRSGARYERSGADPGHVTATYAPSPVGLLR